MSAELATIPSQDPVAAMLQGVIDKGITADNVSSLEQLVGLYERMQKRNAEQEFARSFVALQSEMPAVAATKPVPAKDGTIKYHYAPYEDLMAQVGPMLTKHGFTVTFDSKIIDGGRIGSICTLMHTGGHSRSNEFAVRIGHGPPGASESQADGSARTYAKRGALLDSLNIVVKGMDDDARMEGSGETITKEQVKELMDRVRNLDGVSETKFLEFAGAKTFSEIPASKYDTIDEMLRRKEAKQRA